MDYVEEGKYCLTYGSKYHNPYPRGSVEHNQFERGWSQALKMYPGSYCPYRQEKK